MEVGFRKPHPAPFRRALEALDVSARAALFVGDDARWDVLGACAAGLRPLLVAPTAPGEAPFGGVPVVHHLRDVLKHVAPADQQAGN